LSSGGLDFEAKRALRSIRSLIPVVGTASGRSIFDS
jgi:hypothetical protein